MSITMCSVYILYLIFMYSSNTYQENITIVTKSISVTDITIIKIDKSASAHRHISSCNNPVFLIHHSTLFYCA